MREGGEDDDKGMVGDVKGVWSLGGREMLGSMRDGICVCFCGGGDIDGSGGGGGADVNGGSSGVGNSGESAVYRSGRGGGSIVYRIGGGGLCRSG